MIATAATRPASLAGLSAVGVVVDEAWEDYAWLHLLANELAEHKSLLIIPDSSRQEEMLGFLAKLDGLQIEPTPRISRLVRADRVLLYGPKDSYRLRRYEAACQDAQTPYTWLTRRPRRKLRIRLKRRR